MRHDKELISVIIPCYQEAKHVDKCLKSLIDQTYGSENLEIVVIDGMSTDGTRDVVAKYVCDHKNIIMLDNPKKIAPVAMNMGIKESSGQYIVRIDAHTEIPAEYIERCMDVMTRTGVDVVGGPMETRGSGFWGKMIAYLLSSFFGVGSSFRTIENYEGYVDTVAFGLYKRKVFEKAGEHNEHLVRGHDWEINQRIKGNGSRIYFDSSIRSIYYCTDNPLKLIVKSFKDGYWIAAIFEKHSIRHLIPFFFLLSIVALGLICYWRRHGLGTWGYVYFPLYTYVLSYLSVAFFYSFGMVRSSGWKALVLGPLLYASFHISRGFGILYGMLTGVWLRVDKGDVTKDMIA
jgi:glycosyltransferase involved in cell wall biosynthesis